MTEESNERNKSFSRSVVIILAVVATTTIVTHLGVRSANEPPSSLRRQREGRRQLHLDPRTVELKLDTTLSTTMTTTTIRSNSSSGGSLSKRKQKNLYECLDDLQTRLNQNQSEWLDSKVPILSSVIPHRDGIKAIFMLKQIRQTDIKTYDSFLKNATWYCDSSEPAVVIGRDSHMNTLIVECPNALPSNLKVVEDDNTVHHYAIPDPGMCPWQMQQATLSACTMIRGQSALDQIPEWIAYHSIVGFEQFYIYANEVRNHTKLPLGDKSNVHWIPFQDKLGKKFIMQQAMQNDCIHRARNVSSWVGLFDVDEYFQ